MSRFDRKLFTRALTSNWSINSFITDVSHYKIIYAPAAERFPKYTAYPYSANHLTLNEPAIEHKILPDPQIVNYWTYNQSLKIMVSISTNHHFQLWQNEQNKSFASGSLNSVEAEIGNSRLSF